MKLEFLHEISEASQFRTKSRSDAMTDVQKAEFAFADLNTLYILFNDPQYREYAQDHARDTMRYRNFDKRRIMSTDLYNALHFAKADNPRFSDAAYKRYLNGIASGRLSDSEARGLMLKMETELAGKNSELKSIRRSVQAWPDLNNNARATVLRKLDRFYRANGRYGQLYSTLKLLNSAGYGIAPSTKRGGIPKAAKYAGAAAAGYYLGKRAVSG